MKQIDKILTNTDEFEKMIEEESTQLIEKIDEFNTNLGELYALSNKDYKKINYLKISNKKRFLKKKEDIRQLRETFLSEQDEENIRRLSSRHPVWSSKFELAVADFIDCKVSYAENSIYLKCLLRSDKLKEIKIFDNIIHLSIIIVLNETAYEFIEEEWEIISDYLYLDLHFNKELIALFYRNINHNKISKFKNLELIAFLTRHREFATNFISLWYPLDDQLLEKYDDKLDWSCLSSNPNILWSEELFERYINKIDWFSFCGNIGFPWTLSFIEKYEDQLIHQYNKDAGELSRISENEAIPWSTELIERYKDKWDWWDLSRNKKLPWSIEFIKKYRKQLRWSHLSYNPGVTRKKEIINEFGMRINKRCDLRECLIDLSKKKIEDLLPIQNELKWEYLASSGKLNWTIDLIEKFIGNLEFGYESVDGDGTMRLESGLSSNEYIDWNTELLLKYEHKWDYESLACNDSFISFFNDSIDDDDLELIVI